jgi:hypothetical protein
MNKETFIQEVQEEIDYLRNNITSQQRKNLIAEKFNHTQNGSCIYGLLKMHGEKNGKYLKVTSSSPTYEPLVPFENHEFEVETNEKWMNYTRTALEKYLYMIPRNNQLEILEYIKGGEVEIDLYII